MSSKHPQNEDKGLQAYQPHITVRAAGRLWQLSRAADLEQLWEAMTADSRDFEDERLPYWTELWPSSVALASWLQDRKEEIAGQDCLDLGCGLGLTAMVGQWLGANAPERFGKIILANTACYYPDPTNWHNRIKAVKEGNESVITCYILSMHPSPSCPMA